MAETIPRLRFRVRIPPDQRISWADYRPARALQTTELTDLYSFVDYAAYLLRRFVPGLLLGAVLNKDGLVVVLHHHPEVTKGHPTTWTLGPQYSDDDTELTYDSGRCDQKPETIVPWLVWLLLLHDWFGPDAITLEEATTDNNYWLQAVYCYLDLSGQSYTFWPCDRSTAPINVFPTLYADDELPANLALAHVLGAPQPGTSERRDIMMCAVGYEKNCPPEKPLLLENPDFYFKRIFNRTVPPTNFPPPPPNESEAPLASATDTLRHVQSDDVRDHLARHPVSFFVRSLRGNGASTMLRQAAEQLVQGTQVVFLPKLHVGSNSLHPSLEYAYRNGGIVVLHAPGRYNPEGIDLALSLLAGHPLIGLQYPDRPLAPHADFRLVVELDWRAFTDVLNTSENAALGACVYHVTHDLRLQKALYDQVTPTKGAFEALSKLVMLLPESQRNSLHIPVALAHAPSVSEGIGAILYNSPHVADDFEVVDWVMRAFEVLDKLGKKKTKRPNAMKPSPVTEDATPAEKQAHFVQLVENPGAIPDLPADTPPALPDLGF